MVEAIAASIVDADTAFADADTAAHAQGTDAGQSEDVASAAPSLDAAVGTPAQEQRAVGVPAGDDVDADADADAGGDDDEGL